MSGFMTVRAFTAARDSWWSSRARGGAEAGASKVARAAVSKEQRWIVSGRRYMSAYKGRDGQLVRFPAELVDLVATQIEAVAPKLAAAYDKVLGRFIFDAWREWPVSTGLSKSLLDIELEQSGETFTGRVVSRAPYTVFIKDRAGSAYQRLLRKPGASLPARIVAAMEPTDGR